MPVIKEYLTAPQVAERLGLHVNTILRYLKNGELKGMQFGRIKKHKWWRIQETDLKEFTGGGK